MPQLRSNNIPINKQGLRANQYRKTAPHSPGTIIEGIIGAAFLMGILTMIPQLCLAIAALIKGLPIIITLAATGFIIWLLDKA